MSLAGDTLREESGCDGGSDDCARGGDTSSSRPPWPWLLRRTKARSRTALHGARGQPPGRGRWRSKTRTKRHGERSDRTVRRSAGDTHPTLGLLVLAGSSGEVVDSSALSFITACALQVKMKEQEEEGGGGQRTALPSSGSGSSCSSKLATSSLGSRRPRGRRRKGRTRSFLEAARVLLALLVQGVLNIVCRRDGGDCCRIVGQETDRTRRAQLVTSKSKEETAQT